MLAIAARLCASILITFALVTSIAFTGAEQKGAKVADYPTLDAFTDPDSTDYDMLKTPFEDLDVAAKMKEFLDLDKSIAEARTGEMHRKAQDAKPSALLATSIRGERRFQLALVPAALASLQPLWKAPKWTVKQFETAQRIAERLAVVADAPKLTFKDTDAAGNHAQIQKVVDWYRDNVKKPEMYAAFVLDFFEGPYAGLPSDAKAPLPSAETKKLDDKTELHLCKTSHGPEPWVLQCIREKKLAWSCTLSDAPDQTFAEVKFDKGPPAKLKELGWRLKLEINGARADTPAFLFVGPEGELCFYELDLASAIDSKHKRSH